MQTSPQILRKNNSLLFNLLRISLVTCYDYLHFLFEIYNRIKYLMKTKNAAEQINSHEYTTMWRFIQNFNTQKKPNTKCFCYNRTLVKFEWHINI